MPQAQPAPEPNKAEPKDRGCTDGKERRDSDLCAQWKAADAAFDGARANERQTIIGWIGLLLGSITMAAAIAAALYVKRAAVATEATVGIATEAAAGAAEALNIAARNADAAQEQVEVAQMTAKQQLRAYIKIEPALSGNPIESKKRLVIPLNVINSGHTPAHKCEVAHVCTIQPPDWTWPDGHKPPIKSDSDLIVHSGTPLRINMSGPDGITDAHFDAIARGETTYFGWAVVYYTDVFGEAQESGIRFMIGQTELRSGQVRTAQVGNVAT